MVLKRARPSRPSIRNSGLPAPALFGFSTTRRATESTAHIYAMAEVEQPVTVAVLQQQQQPDVEMEAAQGEASTSKAAAATEDGAEAVGAATTTGEEAATDKKEQSQPPQQPPSGSSAVETLYLNNLNEKISTKVLKETLRNLFRTYGTVLDVVAHRNVRMRGQAFVSMANRDAAARAVKEVKGFPLYGKPINVQFARTPSDAVVKRKTPDLLEVHVEERKVRKSGLDYLTPPCISCWSEAD